MMTKMGKNVTLIAIVILTLFTQAARAILLPEEDRATTSFNVSDYTATVTSSALNVRSCASTSCRVLGKRNKGQTVRVTHHSGAWRRIVWMAGQSAYVHGNFLRRGTGTSSNGTTDTNTSSDSNVTNYTATVTASALNVRSCASTACGIIRQLKQGDTVSVTHHSGLWHRIDWQGGRGAYVHGNYLHKRNKEPLPSTNNSGFFEPSSDPEGLNTQPSSVTFGSSAWASSLSDSDLQQRIDNWQGTDNDPILDRLVSELNARLEGPVAKTANPELTTDTSSSRPQSLASNDEKLQANFVSLVNKYQNADQTVKNKVGQVVISGINKFLGVKKTVDRRIRILAVPITECVGGLSRGTIVGVVPGGYLIEEMADGSFSTSDLLTGDHLDNYSDSYVICYGIGEAAVGAAEMASAPYIGGVVGAGVAGGGCAVSGLVTAGGGCVVSAGAGVTVAGVVTVVVTAEGIADTVVGLSTAFSRIQNPAGSSSGRKAKASNSNIGDVVQTPDTHPGDFSRRRDGNYVNKHTNEVWSKSHTQHNADSEWKVGLKPGKDPTKSKKITVSGDGKIIKFDT